jgi:pimeloyl-ACP methyl ester carboxylesterase
MSGGDELLGRTRHLRRRRKIAGAAVLSYLVFLGLNVCGCTDRLILYPSTAALHVSGTERTTTTLAEGGTLEIWRARSRGAERAGRPKAFVLVFIGNAARAELTAGFFAQDWGDRPVEVWAVNYPGYGGSTGPARLASIPPAALAAYDALRTHAGDAPILVEARSIGTTAALHVAANRPVAGCLLHNPPPLRRLILNRFGWWNLWLLGGPVAMRVPAELDSERNAANVRVPAVFLIAGADAVVPESYQERVVRAYAGESRVVRLKEADHVARASGDALAEYDAAMDWILECATTTTTQPHSTGH